MSVDTAPNPAQLSGASIDPPPPPAVPCSTWSSPSTTRRPTSAASGGCTRTCRRSSRTRSGSRSPTTPAPTARWQHRRAGSPPSCPRCGSSASTRRAAGRALQRGVGGPRRGRPRLHGRRPVHRPRRPAAAGRAADVGAQRPGDRHPADAAARASCAAPSASSSRAATTCCCARRCGARFSDAQCGFKAIRADVAQRAAARWSQDTGWFFDTELLVLAERAGLRIHEVPVDWVDDPDSPRRHRRDRRRRPARHRPGGRGLAAGASRRRAARAARPGRADGCPACPTAWSASCVRFAAIGVASTLAYLLLFMLLRGALGAQAANFVALLAHRGRQHRRQPALHLRRPRPRGAGPPPARGPGRSSARAGCRPAARWRLLRRCRRRSRRRSSCGVLVAANVAATVVRFVLFRAWVFRPRTAAVSMTTPSSLADAPAHTAERGGTARPAVGRRTPACRAAAARAARGRGWARPSLRRRCSLGDRAALPVGPGASGWANAFYSAAVQAGSKSWKALFFGSFDAAQRHHRRQAARLAVGHGAVGAGVRLQRVEHAGAAGAHGRGHRRRCCTPRCGAWSGPRAGPARRRGAGADAGGRADVPLQQPRRAAGAAAGRRRLRRCCGRSRRPSTRWLLLAGVLVGFGVPHQDAAGVPRAARPGGWPTCWRRRRALAAASGSCSPRGVAIVVVRGWWVAGVELWPADSPALHRRLARTTASLELAFGYNGLGRIIGGEGNGGTPGASGRWLPGGRAPRWMPRRRPGGGGMGGFGGRPGSPGCSTRASAARSPGCCPPP